MSGAQTNSLPEDLYDKNWKPGLLYGRKLERWLSGDYDEIYVEDLNELPDDEGYAIKYREGRLGPSETLETFTEEETAIDFIEGELEPE